MRVTLVYIAIILLFCCRKSFAPSPAPTLLFDSIPVSFPLVPLIDEISGITAGKINTGHLLGHEDSGNPPRLYIIRTDGTIARSVYLKGITNRDWEDITMLGNQVFIAETGDNAQAYTGYRFYRFTEPAANVDTVYDIQTIHFTYPDGSHDAEACFIDPVLSHLYIITKRDNKSRIYRISHPYGSTNIAEFVGSLPYNGVVAASVSGDGKELLVKTYKHVYYYRRSGEELLEVTLNRAPVTLPYLEEPQGEAISFAADGSGFYTISEQGFSTSVQLYFYRRRP